MIDELLALPLVEAAARLWQRPEQFVAHVDMDGITPAQAAAFMRISELAGVNDTWRGLYVGRIQPANDRLSVIAALSQGSAAMTQEIINFITLADRPGAFSGLAADVPMAIYLRAALGAEIQTRRQFYAEVKAAAASEEAQRLAIAFAGAMIDEAAHGRAPATGVYVMPRVPFAQLDAQIEYDTLRLAIVPRGMFLSFVRERDSAYIALYWSPDAPLGSQSLGSALGHVVLVLAAAIWRDACVVEHRWYSERTRSTYHYSKSQLRRPLHEQPVVLPRVISHVDWSTAEERDTIARRLHGVRGHYRELRDGHQASTDAHERAEAHGFPPAPRGYTFVAPHVRGSGGEHAPDAARRVVCRGLFTAKIALG